MFSGKTTELIRRVERADIAGKDVKVFKPIQDTRTEASKIETHKGGEYEAEYLEDMDRFNGDTPYDVYAFDECQFFGDEFVRTVKSLSCNAEVIVAGLSTDFRNDPWNPMPQLMALANSVIKLTAVCEKCGAEATCTQRMRNGKPAYKSEDRVYIGSDDSYQARCINCHELRLRQTFLK